VSGKKTRATTNTASGNTGNGISVTGTSSKLDTNAADTNTLAGISVSGTANSVTKSTAQSNTGFDLEDTNPACDSNTWRRNTFGTASQTCIK
jgi:hypothetical protein